MPAIKNTNDRHSATPVGRICAVALFGLGALGWSAAPVRAERIENQTAVFSALDKVTARISKFEVEINKSVDFGSI